MDKYRSRKHLLVLYPDNPSHEFAYATIVSKFNCACILHDSDINVNGETLKPHWHFVISFKDAVWNTALAKQLGVEEHLFVQGSKNIDKDLRYLVHADDPDKFQYDAEKVEGTLAPRLCNLLLNRGEGERAMEVYKIISSKTGHVSYTEVFTEACSKGLYSDFRRMGSGVIQLIKEHNRPDLILGDF